MSDSKFGYFDEDLEKEQIVTKWIVDNFLTIEVDEFKVIEDSKTQNTGVDFVITSEEIFGYHLPYKIDFKAALNYIQPMTDEYNNKPSKIPTFAFELSYLNRHCEEREGWLFGEKYNNTEYYMVGWVWADLPFSYNENGYIEVESEKLKYENIKEVEIMVIHKMDLRNYAKKYNIDKDSALTQSKEMRSDRTYRVPLGNNNKYPILNYSIDLDEKPVNLVIPINDLEKMAIFHKTITEFSLAIKKSEVDTTMISSSIKYSCKLFNNDHSVKDISLKRSLTYSTVINHLYIGASQGLLNPTPSFLLKSTKESIQNAIQHQGVESLTSIKIFLDEKMSKNAISYDELKRYFIELYSNK